jgi:methylmalonyl-CoA/ethylmalonyl-CoA epimerase
MSSESAASLLPAGSRFDHVGYACRDLDADRAGFEQLGYRMSGEPFRDPVQGVSGLFLIAADGPCIELITPLAGSTVLDPWLGPGARMYHLAYAVPDFGAALTTLSEARARVVSQPVPAVAFGGRRICFAMLRVPRLLIELIEMAGAAELPQ